MSRQACHRRGFVMTLVVIVMGIAAGTVAALAYFSAGYYRAHQADRVRLVTQAVSYSALAYTRAHADEWAAQEPAAPVVLDVADLLPADATGSVEITFPDSAPRTCRIAVHVERGRYVLADLIDVDLPAPPASTSSASGATGSS